MRNRSRCASGSGYTPSLSIGFCVASTMNGAGTGCVTPPIETWRSAMTSSSADCTFAGRPVDLVGEHDVGEDRAELDVERFLRRPVDPRAHEVGRHEVRRELQAGEAAAEDARHRLGGERLRETGRAFEQAVAAGEPADEEAFDHEVLAHEDALRFEQRFLEHLFGVRDGFHRVELLLVMRSWGWCEQPTPRGGEVAQHQLRRG